MFGQINLSLKERLEKRGDLIKLYRTRGINRPRRRAELNALLKKQPKTVKPKIMKVIPAAQRLPAVPQRKSVFSAVRNMFKRGNV